MAQIFRLFPVQIVRRDGIRAFLRESGRSCNHVFNSWDLGEGKKTNKCVGNAPKQGSSFCPGENLLFDLWFKHQDLSFSDLIYYLLISIQPRSCSLLQRAGARGVGR